MIGLASFSEGSHFIRDNMPGVIVLANHELCVLKYKNTLIEPETVQIQQLENELDKTFFFSTGKEGNKKATRVLTHKDKVEILRRETFLDFLARETGGAKSVGGLKARQNAIEKTIKVHPEFEGPSPATLANWAKDKYGLAEGVAHKVLYKTKQRYKSKFDYLRQLALEVIDEKFLNESKPTCQSTFDYFVDMVKEKYGKNAEYPSYVTFSNWIMEIAYIEMAERRLGKKATNAQKRNAIAKLKTERPLQRVEVDGIRIALGLVDDEGNYLGIPTLIIALDAYTRCVVGYCLHIGKGEPASTYIDTFRHSIFPKHGTFNPNCENEWPCYGLWESAVLDGGTGATSNKTFNYLLSTGVPANVVQTASGWKKPFVERFNGTLRTNLLQNLPSYAGHDVTQVSDRSIKEKAFLTPTEFTDLFEKWLIDEYMQSPHSGIKGKTPSQMWNEARMNGFTPLLPDAITSEKLKLPDGEKEFRVISGAHCHQGLKINNIIYNDSDKKLKNIGLALKQKNLNATVECHYSVSDISKITVINPETEELIVIKATDTSIKPGTSLAEYKAKNPPLPYNKGYARKRTLMESEEYKAALERYKAKTKSFKPRKQRAANTEELTASVIKQKQKLQGQEEAIKNKKQYSDSIDDFDISELKGHDYDN